MATKKINYIKRIKAIRPFVNFDYNLNDVKKIGLSPSQKREVTKYFKAVNQLTARPFHAYRPKTKKNLEVSREYAHPDIKLKYLNTIFIPTDGKKGVRVKISKSGEMKVKTKYVTQKYIPLNKVKLAKDAKSHVKTEIKKYPEADNFLIRCGMYEIQQPAGRKNIADKVERLTKTYGDKEKNNYFGNWLHGLTANKFDNQASMKSYLLEKSKAKKELKRERRNKKRRK